MVGYSTLHGQYEVSGRSSKNSDLSVEQFSVWVKHYCAVSFLSFGSYSAHFLDFKLDSAQTDSQGSELSLRPILRPALCGHAYWLPLFSPHKKAKRNHWLSWHSRFKGRFWAKLVCRCFKCRHANILYSFFVWKRFLLAERKTPRNWALICL